jgi:hypothetical protein
MDKLEKIDNSTYFGSEYSNTYVITSYKANNAVCFLNNENQNVGVLDFNGPQMTFKGNADESAKKFIEFAALHFQQRLQEERLKAHEAIRVKVTQALQDYTG